MSSRSWRRWVAVLVVLLGVDATRAPAQLRFELGAGGGSNPVATPLGKPGEFGSGGSLSFQPTWMTGADATFWLGVVGLRGNAVVSQRTLTGGSPLLADATQSVNLLSGTADVVVPFLFRRPPYLFGRRFAYLAVGGGYRWLNSPSSAGCPVTGEAPGCGVAIQTDSGAFLISRGARPVGLAAFGVRLPFGPRAALKLELGDRVSHSPLVRLTPDGSGGYSRGEAVRTLTHEPFVQLNLQLLAGRGIPQPSALPQLTRAASSEGTKPPADAILLSYDERVDTLVTRGGIQQVSARKPGVKRAAPVTAVQSVDSVKPRVAGNDGIYDVVLDVPNVSVDEITLEVDNLHAHVSLDAKVAKLVSLNVGADAGIERVYLGIRGVQAQAHLKVDLDNVATIVDRVLTTIDRNPEIITGLLETLDRTVATVGNVANTALQPGGVVSQAVQTVGSVANTALQPGGVVSEAVRTVGDVANTALAPNGVIAQTVQTVGGVANTALAPNGVLAQTVNTVGGVANTALQPGGVVGQVVGAVGGTLQNLTAQNGLLSAQGIDALGQTVVRVVDNAGKITQHTLDRSGALVSQSVAGDALQLPVLGEARGGEDRLYRTVRDVSGAIILLTLDAAQRVLGVQVLQQAGVGVQTTLPLPTGSPISLPESQINRPEGDDSSDEPFVMQQGEPVDDVSNVQWIDTIPPPSGASGPEGASSTMPTQQLVLGVTLNARGQTLQRVLDATGSIWERTIDPATGRVLFNRSLGNVLRLAAVKEQTSATGELVRVVRDASGALLELGFNSSGLLSRIRLVQMGDLAGVVSAAQRGVTSLVDVAETGSGVVGAASGVVNAATQSLTGSGVVGGLTTNLAPSGTPVADGRGGMSGGASVRAGPAGADTVQQLLLGQSTNEQGQVVLRLVDIRGNISERSLNAGGQLIVRRRLGNVRLLAPLREYVDVSGRYIRLVRDEQGAMLELTFSNEGKLVRVRVLERPGATTTAEAGGQSGSLLGQMMNAAGQLVQRTVESSGRIVERTFDATGRVLQQREIGNVLKLPALTAVASPGGQLVVVARDPAGALLEVLLRASDRSVIGVRALEALEKR